MEPSDIDPETAEYDFTSQSGNIRSHNTFTFIETEVADNAQAALAKARQAYDEAIYATERAELALNESKWAVVIAIVAVVISIVVLGVLLV